MIIKGRVVDDSSGDPLGWATIALFNPVDSSLITGDNTHENGSFSLTVQRGTYLFRAGFMGYNDYYTTLKAEGSEVNLGTIRLYAEGTTLEEITVEGGRALFENDIDKRVFNVENSILAQGGSASELLATLPSIQVDENGGISMRGSGNILIYINGRPSNLSGDDSESILEQFPANSIKSVELITNPSSRYDAAGVGGIINIILKKDERRGLNGQVNSSAGTRHKYTGGLNLNYSSGKWNLFTNYNYQYRELYMLSESFRESKKGSGSPILDQDFDTQAAMQSHLIRSGADYSINDKSTLGFYVQGNLRSRERGRVYNQRYLNAARNLDSMNVRHLTEKQKGLNFESGITYNLDIDSSGQKLFGSVSFAKDQQDRIENFDQLYFNQALQEIPENRILQIYGRPSNSNLYLFQLDYEKPLENAGKIEAGFKSTISQNYRSQEFLQKDLQLDVYFLNDTISNAFRFDEIVHAGYLIHRGEFEKFGYQAGLRGELTLTESFQENNQETFVNNYFNLFPSLFLSYEVNKGKEIQANYSRRIERPGLWSLTPFYNAQDLLNLRIGNPYLQPEFTHSYEAGYMQETEHHFFMGTVYHRRSTDILTRLIEIRDNNVAVQTWANANSRISTGLELINQFYFTKNIDATVTGNFFHSEIIGSNIAEGLNNSNFSWTINVLGNIKIPGIVSVQLQSNYRGPIVIPQGEIAPMFGLNIGAKKDFWDKKATLSLNVSDVFYTQIFRIQTSDAHFYQERMFNRETRIGTLSFTYRFKGYKEQQKKKNSKGDDFSGDSEMF